MRIVERLTYKITINQSKAATTTTCSLRRIISSEVRNAVVRCTTNDCYKYSTLYKPVKEQKSLRIECDINTVRIIVLERTIVLRYVTNYNVRIELK